MTKGALAGLRVVDLTHHIAGPYATKLLADFGADVVKIERPGGDPARRLPPFYHDDPHPDRSLPFLYLNTNKRSVTLNLKSEEGRGILLELLKDADAVVDNFAPRVMPSLGLDADTLREHNPRLVVASVTNFGQSGPWRDYKATEIVSYALGGLMYIFGAYDREPLKHALHQAQFKAGTNLASATLMALYHQRMTGQGQLVDVSIQESIASALRDVTNTSPIPEQSGGGSPITPATSPGFAPPPTAMCCRIPGWAHPWTGKSWSTFWMLPNWQMRGSTMHPRGSKTRKHWARYSMRFSPPSRSRRYSIRPTKNGSSTV